MEFEILGRIEQAETIAISGGIRELVLLSRKFGLGRWRKMKGIASVRLYTGAIRQVELHWYEAHGIGKRKIKIKRFLD